MLGGMEEKSVVLQMKNKWTRFNKYFECFMEQLVMGWREVKEDVRAF